MDEDFASIEAWAKIFTQPATLSKTVAKNWLLHGRKIKADIKQEETDWSSGDYFQAGKDTADALQLAVGPMKADVVKGINVKAPVEFVGGLLEGLISENHLDEIQTCVTDSEGLVSNIEELVQDIEAKNLIKAGKLVKTIKDQIPAMLGDCKTMGDEMKALEKWATAFEHPKNIGEEFAKAMLLHHKKLTQDISDVKTDWAAQQYYASGKAAADILYTVIGPVPQPAYTYKMDWMAGPDLAAGFLYGMVGDSDLVEVKKCYTSTQPLYKDLTAALGDLEHFHLVKAMKQFEKFVYQFQLDMQPCTHMGDDLAAIEQWAAAFKNFKALITSAARNLLTHRKQVTADIGAIKSDWGDKEFFKVGRDAADLLTELVGPIQ